MRSISPLPDAQVTVRPSAGVSRRSNDRSSSIVVPTGRTTSESPWSSSTIDRTLSFNLFFLKENRSRSSTWHLEVLLEQKSIAHRRSRGVSSWWTSEQCWTTSGDLSGHDLSAGCRSVAVAIDTQSISSRPERSVDRRWTWSRSITFDLSLVSLSNASIRSNVARTRRRSTSKSTDAWTLRQSFPWRSSPKRHLLRVRFPAGRRWSLDVRSSCSICHGRWWRRKDDAFDDSRLVETDRTGWRTLFMLSQFNRTRTSERRIRRGGIDGKGYVGRWCSFESSGELPTTHVPKIASPLLFHWTEGLREEKQSEWRNLSLTWLTTTKKIKRSELIISSRD